MVRAFRRVVPKRMTLFESLRKSKLRKVMERLHKKTLLWLMR